MVKTEYKATQVSIRRKYEKYRVTSKEELATTENEGTERILERSR